MKYRGGFRFSSRILAARLGISEKIYKIAIEKSGDVTFYCYDAQDSHEVREGEEAPIVRISNESDAEIDPHTEQRRVFTLKGQIPYDIKDWRSVSGVTG